MSYAVQGVAVSREAFLASNNEWYKSFGFNPVTISDARLAYAAPRFTKRDWQLFCSMALAADLDPRTNEPPLAGFSRIFSGPSLAHQACVAFSEAAAGKRFGALPPCFEFTHAAPARDFRHAVHETEAEYARACAHYEGDGSVPPLHLIDPFRIRMMVFGCFHDSRHTSRVTRHTSHVTRHPLHVIRHSSRVTHHTSPFAAT